MPNTTRQLEGYRARLERDLARALGSTLISSDLIERLVRDLAQVDQQLAVAPEVA